LLYLRLSTRSIAQLERSDDRWEDAGGYWLETTLTRRRSRDYHNWRNLAQTIAA
jgi:hypothetical protein